MEILVILAVFTLTFVASGIATYRFCRRKNAQNADTSGSLEDGDDNGR